MMKKGEILVDVQGLSKKFSRSLKRGMWYGIAEVVRSILGLNRNRSQLKKEEFWAVRDVSFQLRRGECIGLIGHNGAGKSTLLKMLNGLIRPDEGSITMRGKVGALIELGAGFNPILTGRENIYINGQLLGISKTEIDNKLPAILEFAEIDEFIDSPIQNYSSGMRVRLGFAIAAQMEPDVLIIDEVLAVGDVGFVLKCFNKMDQLLPKTAMILVSHRMPQIARMCTDILLMEHGKCTFQSKEIATGIMKYYELFKNETGDFQGSDRAKIISIKLSSNGIESKPGETLTIQYAAELTIEVEIDCLEGIPEPRLSYAFYDKEQRIFAQADNFSEQIHVDKFVGVNKITATIPNIIFAQGVYSITISMHTKENNVREVLFRFQSAIFFNVEGKARGTAPVQLNAVWSLNN